MTAIYSSVNTKLFHVHSCIIVHAAPEQLIDNLIKLCTSPNISMKFECNNEINLLVESFINHILALVTCAAHEVLFRFDFENTFFDSSTQRISTHILLVQCILTCWALTRFNSFIGRVTKACPKTRPRDLPALVSHTILLWSCFTTLDSIALCSVKKGSPSLFRDSMRTQRTS